MSGHKNWQRHQHRASAWTEYEGHRSKAPWWLKISVVFVALIKASFLSQLLGRPVPARPIPFNLASVISYGAAALEFCALVAIWKMQRWGVLLLAALTAVHVVSAAMYPGTTWRAPVGVAIIAGIVLVPAILVWRRMTPTVMWRYRRRRAVSAFLSDLRRRLAGSSSPQRLPLWAGQQTGAERMADADAKPWGRRLWLWIIGGLALLGILSSRAQKPEPQTAATEVTPKETPEALAARAIVSVRKEQLPTWQGTDVEYATTGVLGGIDYHLSLVYNPTLTTPALPIVERETTAMARALLQTLVAAGYRSKDIHIAVFARVGTPKGFPGQQLVLPLGWTHYDSTSDSLKFETPDWAH
jgi:hypothetical protein